MTKSRLRIHQAAHYTVIDDTAVVLDGRRGKYLGLNETAGRILALLAEGHSVERVAEMMSDDYEVDTSVLRQDVDRFVQEMEAMGLLVPAPSEEAGSGNPPARPL